MADYRSAAQEIIAAVGGTDNVASVTHCMTRLRFNLKDESLANDETLEKIERVISVVHGGGQVQLVIGPTVDKMYTAVCEEGGFTVQEAIDENLDGDAVATEQLTWKERFAPKRIVSMVFGTLSGIILPVLPVIIVVGLFRMVTTLFAPGYLGILDPESDLYRLLTLAGDAGYYYYPVFTAWSAAKYFKCSPVLALFITCIMIHPDMLAIVEAGEPFTVYGIPMYEVSYVQAVIPIIMVVWAQKYVEGFFRKVTPDMIRTVGIPLGTIVVMLPLALCLFGPICYVIMQGVASALLWLTAKVGLVASIIIPAIWPIVIMFGMHVPILVALLPAQMELGYDVIVYPAMIVGTFATMALFLAYGLRAKGRENKALGWECFVTYVTANISEPGLYGIQLRDMRALLYGMIGSAAGGLTAFLLNAKVYIFSGVGFPFLNMVRFGEDIVPGTIACIVAAVVTFALSMVLGFQGEQKDEVALPFLKKALKK